MIEIDGSMGEGGGQIVRTALALSLATQRPFRIANVRANRSRPGLRQQHLTAVEAAATIGAADVSRVEEGASAFTFAPTTVAPGRYQFDVGTAGSAVLVLQTVLPPLLTAPAPTTVTVTGGTHVRSAPPFDFFATTFLPLVERMGPVLYAALDRPGFYPKGGGRCTVEIEPAASLDPLTLREGLPVGLDETRIETPSARGAGNALLLTLADEHVTTVVSGIGEKGIPAEDVAMDVVNEARRYLAADAPVGPHLADQLLVPLALGGGAFRTTVLTDHTHTNAAVIERFVEERLSVEEERSGWLVAAQN